MLVTRETSHDPIAPVDVQIPIGDSFTQALTAFLSSCDDGGANPAVKQR